MNCSNGRHPRWAHHDVIYDCKFETLFNLILPTKNLHSPSSDSVHHAIYSFKSKMKWVFTFVRENFQWKRKGVRTFVSATWACKPMTISLQFINLFTNKNHIWTLNDFHIKNLIPFVDAQHAQISDFSQQPITFYCRRPCQRLISKTIKTNRDFINSCPSTMKFDRKKRIFHRKRSCASW